MASIELITSEPAIGDFVPLAEHQAQTPDTFFHGKPVLYFHCTGALITIAKDQLDANVAISGLISSETSAAEGAPPADENAPSHSASATGTVDVWVTSEKLVLFNSVSKMGASLPYPSISLHATRKIDETTEAVYMQLELSNPEEVNDVEDYKYVELDIVPLSTTTVDASSSETNQNAEPNPTPEDAEGASAGIAKTNGTSKPESSTQALYNAIVACTDLHPDPNEADSEDGDGQGPSLITPGAGGWITSENMADFTDEDGNFKGFDAEGNFVAFGEEGSSATLGAGAGTRRPREEGDGEIDDAEEVDGDGKEREETKWQRTE